MGHEARDVARGVHDAGDRPERAVRVGGVARLVRRRPVGPGVAEQHLAGPFQLVERRVVGVEAALAVGDRHPQRPALADRPGERRVEPLRDDRDLARDEPQPAVAEQGAGQEMRLGQDLEAVADPEDEPAIGGERGHGAHHRAEPGDHAGPQVVAVGEAARQDHPGDAVEGRRLVPQDDRLGAGDLERVDGIDVAVRAREQHDPDPDGHAGAPTIDEAAPISSTTYDSMSGFDRSSDGEPLDRRPGGRRVVGGDRQLDPPADPDGGDALDPEVAEAALDRPALRVEDARLRRDVDGEPEVRAHRAITSSAR